MNFSELSRKRKSPKYKNMFILLNWAEHYLMNYNIRNARNEAEFLISGVLDCSKKDLYLTPKLLDTISEKTIRQLVKKRTQGTPLQILLGNTQFMDWIFLVQKGVFIPRMETEILVEEAYRIIKKFSSISNKKILDMGTGSGVIAVSLAKKIPDVQIYAIDKSISALCLAKKNAEILGVKNRIFFRRGDLFFALKKKEYQKKFFVIAANLPYIPKDCLAQLPIEVKNFDSLQSLDGGNDGVELYQRMLSQACRYLHKKGFIIIEIGEEQENRIKKFVELDKKLTVMRVIKDYRKQNRVIVLKRK